MYRIYIILIIELTLASCSSGTIPLKIDQRQSVLKTSITDFLSTEPSLSNHNVFMVFINDTVNRMGRYKINKSTSGFKVVKKFENLISVSIMEQDGQFALTPQTIPGSKPKMPSNFIEKGGKLFIWFDESQPITEKLLEVYQRYGLLKKVEKDTDVPVPIDDSLQSVHYYFCRYAPNQFKKIITTTAVGYYDPPKIKCKE